MSIIYGIISIPVFLGVLWWIFNLIFSPLIVTNNILEAITPSTSEKVDINNQLKKSSFDLKSSFDPKYTIEDPLQFKD